jgi:hypothetical protein
MANSITSVSGFHHHFKAVTATSPLQFQKRLREAAGKNAGTEPVRNRSRAV